MDAFSIENEIKILLKLNYLAQALLSKYPTSL